MANGSGDAEEAVAAPGVLERDEIVRRAYELFSADAEAVPPMTLRGGDALDRYDAPPTYDAAVDAPTDEYMSRYAYGGVPFLDPVSWRHYLPRLIEYALGHLSDDDGMVIEGLLWSLRPPDRDPPRLGSLTAEQEAVVVAFLDHLAFGEEEIPDRELAMQVMEEWWLPNALYRRPTNAAS
jgi:hypothetical protein